VNILHIGRNEAEGYFYYVMELADDQARGREIDPDTYAPRTIKSELMLRERLPFAECLGIAHDLALALEHLHTHHLVHRDIKPSNIIFVNGRPKLADIGLVSAIDATRSYVGTEGYVPPEGPGTVQADLFSLGMVVYEIATGCDRRQFPELPTGFGLEAGAETALLELNEVIGRACDPDPKRRYGTVAALRADLELLQAGQSVARLRNVEKRLCFVQRAGALVTALALVIAAGWFWQARQTEIVRQLVDEKTQVADDNRQIAEERTALADEKTLLAEEKSALAEENRERLVRLSVANGVRLLDNDDPTGALLWFAQALPLVADRPAEEEIHRIRIGAVQSTTPRPLLAASHPDGKVIFSGAFSPDGQRIATSSFETGIRVWQTAASEHQGLAVQLDHPIRHVQFSPDGRRLIALESFENTKPIFAHPEITWPLAALIDAATGRTLQYLVTNATKTVLSPDARWLAASRSDFTVALIDTADGRVAAECVGHTDFIHALSFSADGNLLATGSADGTARVWHVLSGKPAGPALRHKGMVLQAWFRPGRAQLLTANVITPPTGPDHPGHVQFWDYQSGAIAVSSTRVAGAGLQVLAMDPHEGRRVFLCTERALQVRDADTLEEVLPRVELGSAAMCLAFRPDGRVLAVGCADGATHIVELDRGTRLFPPIRQNAHVESLTFSPDGAQVLVTSDDGTAKLWDLTGAAETFPEHGSREPLVRWAASQDRGTLAAVWFDLTVSLIDLETFTERTPRQPIPNADSDPKLPMDPWVAVDSTGRHWAALTRQSPVVGLWRAEANGVRYLELRHPAPAEISTFSASGDRLITLDFDDDTVRVWDTENGHLVQTTKLPEQGWFLMGLDRAGTRIPLTDRAPGCAAIAASGAFRGLHGIPAPVASAAVVEAHHARASPGQRLSPGSPGRA
jgi:WD40 repeat protein/cell division protein FtsB